MYNFITIAAADGACPAGAQGAGGMISLVPMIVIFAVMFYFMYRSQKKQARKRQEMIDKIVKGSDVIIGGGIYGTVVSVKDKTFIVEIADKVNIEVTKGGVNGTIGAGGDVAANE
ncbi:MAG: preprotein translocase subunit YajC [Victivallaceae bacterium]|nr:preprotein translocase subunit YajC [Victivallaceae bacterium]